jgi:hypothetical protein
MTIVFQPNQILTAEQLNQAFSDANSSASSLAANLASPTGAGLIGFQQAGAGAVSETVQSVLQRTISVLDFGAKCDWNGSTGTDDTASITAAFNAALARGISQAMEKVLALAGSLFLRVLFSSPRVLYHQRPLLPPDFKWSSQTQ